MAVAADVGVAVVIVKVASGGVRKREERMDATE